MRQTQFYTTHLPVERSFGVIIVEVDPVEEQLLDDRVADVRVVSEDLEVGEDLEIVEQERVLRVHAGGESQHARHVIIHVVRVGLVTIVTRGYQIP